MCKAQFIELRFFFFQRSKNIARVILWAFYHPLRMQDILLLLRFLAGFVKIKILHYREFRPPSVRDALLNPRYSCQRKKVNTISYSRNNAPIRRIAGICRR